MRSNKQVPSQDALKFYSNHLQMRSLIFQNSCCVWPQRMQLIGQRFSWHSAIHQEISIHQRAQYLDYLPIMFLQNELQTGSLNLPYGE